jgi:mitogen-activated protein kinase 1/3
MLSGKPLFPGRDYHHQLTLILDVLGTPTLDEFYAITTRRSRDYIRALPFRKKKPFQTIFPNANPLAIDFLSKTLVHPLLLPFLYFLFFAQLCYSVRRLTRRSALRSSRHSRTRISRLMCVNMGAAATQTHLLSFTCQHDPDDEPVAPPLDPEFFEFDCGCLFDGVRDLY